jgi:hypothetical protein
VRRGVLLLLLLPLLLEEEEVGGGGLWLKGVLTLRGDLRQKSSVGEEDDWRLLLSSKTVRMAALLSSESSWWWAWSGSALIANQLISSADPGSRENNLKEMTRSAGRKVSFPD